MCQPKLIHYWMHSQLYIYFIITAFFHSFSLFPPLSRFGTNWCTCLSVSHLRLHVIEYRFGVMAFWERFWSWQKFTFLSSHRFIVAWLCSLSRRVYLWVFHLSCIVAECVCVSVFLTESEGEKEPHRTVTVAVVEANASEAFHFIIHILFAFNFHIFRRNSTASNFRAHFSLLCIAFINILLVLYTKICHFVHYFRSRW